MATNRTALTDRIRSVWGDLRQKSEAVVSRPGGVMPYEVEAPVYAPPTEDELGRGAYEPYVEPSVRLAAAWSWRSLVVLAAAAALFWLLGKVAVVLLPALIALLIAALLSPVALFLRTTLKFPRALAATVAFVGFLVVVSGLLSLVGQQIVSGFQPLVNQVIAGYQSVVVWLQTEPFGIDAAQVATFLDEGLGQALAFLETNASRIAGGAAGAVSSVGSFLTGLVLTLFTAFFFVLDGRRIYTWFIGLLPRPSRNRAESAGLRGWQTLVQYVRVQIIVAAVDAVLIGLGAWIIGWFFEPMPLLIPLAVLIFMASFIPIVGAVVTGIMAVLVSLVTQGLVPAVLVLGVVLLVQQLEGNVLQPLIMGKAVAVHPLAVVLAVATGGFLFGIPGALFAVPVVATLNSVVLQLVGRGDEVDEDGDAAPPGEDPGGSGPVDPGPGGSGPGANGAGAASTGPNGARPPGAGVPGTGPNGSAAAEGRPAREAPARGASDAEYVSAPPAGEPPTSPDPDPR
ncbi:AI-2E family transporter [Brevibacterium litoralis]|uniref:AI-2E family transporter n=1 Tax=Brevibacterium litoralis TaxID=3138935 RepID=UPI0032EB4604